ncbi:MAG: stage II sporulation protein M [Clostridia bacterium]|nr:stage II sporulation protein M [Clostridia bacterium]
MRVTPKKNSKILAILIKHIKDNLKAYLIVSSILLIGIILGVLFVNSLPQEKSQEIQTYLTDFTTSVKDGNAIDNGQLLKKSITNNIILTLLMWFVGSTVIGIPIVLGIVAFRGFCLGYTISSVIAVWGIGKGTLFFVCSMLLQNLIFLPCMLALAVSGIKLYQSIMKDKRKENIKFEIFRHTIFSIIIFLFLLLSSFIETYISTNLLTFYIPYL